MRRGKPHHVGLQKLTHTSMKHTGLSTFPPLVLLKPVTGPPSKRRSDTKGQPLESKGSPRSIPLVCMLASRRLAVWRRLPARLINDRNESVKQLRKIIPVPGTKHRLRRANEKDFNKI